MAKTYIRGKLVDRKASEIGNEASRPKSPHYKFNKLRNYFKKIKSKFKDSFDRDAYFDNDTF